MLFHISEDPSIGRFEPRLPADGGSPVVWAIDADRLHNDLVPRDCPGVAYYAGPATSPTPYRNSVFRGVELRVVPNLWPLRDAVAGSSLHFSIIRMRNALPRLAV